MVISFVTVKTFNVKKNRVFKPEVGSLLRVACLFPDKKLLTGRSYFKIFVVISIKLLLYVLVLRKQYIEYIYIE